MVVPSVLKIGSGKFCSLSCKAKYNWSNPQYAKRMSNQDCDERMEAHHILGWVSYPELRYEINNGITLCHAHHPRKRALEKELAPIFQELVKG